MNSRINATTLAEHLIMAPLLPVTTQLTGIQCSTAHITDADNLLLYHISHQYEEYGDCESIHFTGTGYLLRLFAWQYPVLKLKRLGLSKHCRRLIVTLMERHNISLIHLDAAGDVLPGFATFD